jgi:iron complex transport system substrate-binding protein
MTGRTRTRTPNRTAPRFPHALLLALALALVLAALTGCGDTTDAASEVPATAAFPMIVTDDAGRDVTIQTRPERIVSLAPANTEIVAALGATDRLVGVTTLCDYPAEVAGIAKVGDFAQPNLEAVAAADPDLVLATTGVQADVIAQLEELGASVIAIDPQSLEGVFTSIGTVGAAIGEPQAAAELTESMRIQLEDISETVESAPVTCFLEIAQDPLFTAGRGTLLNDLIEVAAGENVVTEEGYVPYSVEQLVAADPEVYLATKGSMSDPADIGKRPGYSSLRAVATGRVYVLDDNLVSRPGPRVVEGVRQIAQALHPDAFGE